jgi:hypothetical protein
MFVGGLLLVGFNLHLLMTSDRFYPNALVTGCFALGAGGFGGIFGWSKEFRGQPTWWQVGAWASCIAGAGAGFGACHVLAP